MLWEPIIKSSPKGGVAPNLRNYEQARAAFSWEEARNELDGLPDVGGLNIAHEVVDRHAACALRDRPAIKGSGKDGSVRDFSFERLRNLTNRFANALGKLGVGRGDRVYALMGRIPEHYVMALGEFKNRSVFCPLSPAFCPELIKGRTNIGGAKVLVTTESLYQRKVVKIRNELPSPEHVLLKAQELRLPIGDTSTLETS
jgi:acetyl-CoA synthetase